MNTPRPLTKLSTKYKRRANIGIGSDLSVPRCLPVIHSSDSDTDLNATESQVLSGNINGIKSPFRESEISTFMQREGSDCQGWRQIESTHIGHLGTEDISVLTEDKSVRHDSSLFSNDDTEYQTAQESQNTSRPFAKANFNQTPRNLTTASSMTPSILFSINKRKSIMPIRRDQVLADDSEDENEVAPLPDPKPKTHDGRKLKNRRSTLGRNQVLLLPSDSDDDFVDSGRDPVEHWIATSPLTSPQSQAKRKLSDFVHQSAQLFNNLDLNEDSSLSLSAEQTSCAPKEDTTEGDTDLWITKDYRSFGVQASFQDSSSSSLKECFVGEGGLESSDESLTPKNLKQNQSLQVSLEESSVLEQSRENVAIQVSFTDSSSESDVDVDLKGKEASASACTDPSTEKEIDNVWADLADQSNDEVETVASPKCVSKPRSPTSPFNPRAIQKPRRMIESSSEDEEELQNFFLKLRRQAEDSKNLKKEAARRWEESMDNFIVNDDEVEYESSASDESARHFDESYVGDSEASDNDGDVNDRSETSEEDQFTDSDTSENRKLFDTSPEDTPVSKTSKKESPKLGQLTLMQSLSLEYPTEQCHPLAKKYLTHFEKNKHELARFLFRLFNEEVFLHALDPETQINWKPRLTKTAGTCVQRRKLVNGQGVVRSCEINLSEKVLDSPDRLRDTLIHEMCHAATWMISGVSGGHGPVWKDWAKKAMNCFQDLPLIARCHSYVIRTKYSYVCKHCGSKVNRHSKSLDTNRFRCGKCKGEFELFLNQKASASTKTPGKRVEATTPKTPNAFALFVKDNYKHVRKNGVAHKDAMVELSKQFAASKIKS